MWKYRSTNEMFTGHSTKLYHSDTYMGKDFSDGIKHYKYLRKYNKNGHTYYIYDESQLKRAEAKARAANEITRKGYWDGNTHTSSYYTKDGSHVTMRTSIGGRPMKNTKKNIRDKQNYMKAESYIKKHATQKLKDIPRRIHARGIAAVSRFIRFIRGD